MESTSVTKNCEEPSCGREYQAPRRKAASSRYCSRACANAGAKVHEDRTCAGKDCTETVRGKRKFCSPECYRSIAVNRQPRSDTGARRAEWVEVECSGCGTPIERRKSETRKSAFCTTECYQAHPERRGSGRPPLPDGTRRVDRSGYATVKRGGRWEGEHRVVMEAKLGRSLLPGENVHHKNGVKDDNRPENLELWITSQPKGQLVEDVVAWAEEVLALYRPLVAS